MTHENESRSPKKGEIGGECNRSACKNGNATWYNQSTQKHYCGPCAFLLNDANHADAKRLLSSELCIMASPSPDTPPISHYEMEKVEFERPRPAGCVRTLGCTLERNHEGSCFRRGLFLRASPSDPPKAPDDPYEGTEFESMMAEADAPPTSAPKILVLDEVRLMLMTAEKVLEGTVADRGSHLAVRDLATDLLQSRATVSGLEAELAAKNQRIDGVDCRNEGLEAKIKELTKQVSSLEERLRAADAARGQSRNLSRALAHHRDGRAAGAPCRCLVPTMSDQYMTAWLASVGCRYRYYGCHACEYCDEIAAEALILATRLPSAPLPEKRSWITRLIQKLRRP